MEGRGSAAGRLAVVATVFMLAMVSGALATSHVVGGTRKWDFAPTNDIKYYDSTWAANQSFAVGDTLQFEYTAGEHNVVRYNTSADYNACSGTPVQEWGTGNDSVPLTTAGTYYFICSFTGHCSGGMKVSVTVGAAVAPASPPTTAPVPSPAVPSPSPTTPSPSPTTPSPSPTTPSPSPTTPSPSPTTPSPSPTTPSPSPTTPSSPTSASPAPTVSSPPPPPPNAASSGPVLSMAGLLTASLVAILATLE